VNLSERVDEDLKTAMRERNATKLGVLRMLKAALTNATIAKGGADSKLTGGVLAGLLRRTRKDVDVISVSDAESVRKCAATISN
jgi:uncharacterized protein YqeY